MEQTVTYRKVPLWQVILGQLKNGAQMAFYVLINMIAYLGSGGYGIDTILVGTILTFSRIFDGVIDPFLAVAIDRFNTKHGKIRYLLIIGFCVRACSVLLLYNIFSNGKHGIVMFLLLYLLQIVGNSIYDIVSNMVPAVMTNDPKQRPSIEVWGTVYSYLFPTLFTVLSTFILLPRYNNEYSVPFLRSAALMFVGFAAVLTLIALIGLGPIDKPENFKGISASEEDDDVSMKDMAKFLKENKPFRLYTISCVAEKLAQNVTSQAIITNMIFGILIGNIQFGTMLTVVSMLPAIVFAIIGAKHAGKAGSLEANLIWTKICVAVTVLTLVFCTVIDMRSISGNIIMTVLFFVMLLVSNGARMCTTTASGAMRADIVDYELERSGKYLPAVVTATYNFIDQLVTSLGATIATLGVSLIGYRNTLPQPTDAPTPAIKGMALFLYFGLPLLTWIAALIALRGYHLTKDEMVRVQQTIAARRSEEAEPSAE